MSACLAKVLMLLYQRDILSEGAILAWHAESDGLSPESLRVRQQVRSLTPSQGSRDPSQGDRSPFLPYHLSCLFFRSRLQYIHRKITLGIRVGHRVFILKIINSN